MHTLQGRKTIRESIKTQSDQYACHPSPFLVLQKHRTASPQIYDLIRPTWGQQSGISDVRQLLSFCHASVTTGKGVNLFLLSSFSHRCTDNGSHFLVASSLTHLLYLCALTFQLHDLHLFLLQFSCVSLSSSLLG